MFVLESLNSEAGTENQLSELIRGMDSKRFELFTACVEDAIPSRQLDSHATPLVFPMTAILSWNGFHQILRLRSEINRLQIDIVHTFMVRATIVGVLAARGSTCKVILTSRRNLGYWYTPMYLRVFRILNRMTTRVVANSEAAKQAAMRIEGLSGSRIDVLCNGVDLARFSGSGDASLLDRRGISRSSKIVGIVANYRPVKDLPMFIRAARLIAASHEDVVFLLVGQGPLRQSLEALAEQIRNPRKGVLHRWRGLRFGILALIPGWVPHFIKRGLLKRDSRIHGCGTSSGGHRRWRKSRISDRS